MQRLLLVCVALLSLFAWSARVEAGSSIKSDEEVVLFTTVASWQGDGWLAPIHGWIFEPETDSLWRGALVESLRATLKVSAGQEAIFRKHLRWFLVDNESRKKITVTALGAKAKMPKSGSNGHFQGSLKLMAPAYRESVQVVAKTRKGDSRRFAGKILLVPEQGISVISDIDDTIKITQSWDKEKTLESTFLSSFQAVPDMATLYRRWKKEGAVFHYVSAGPWHLFVPLTSFFNRVAFPEGSVHLQNFRLTDESRFNLLESPHKHKTEVIEALLSQFPKRSFVLVGDSGQEDPEIYAAIARKHASQIRAIYIRRVGPVGMSEQRLRAVQSDLVIPVQVFDKPAKLAL